MPRVFPRIGSTLVWKSGFSAFVATSLENMDQVPTAKMIAVVIADLNAAEAMRLAFGELS